MNKRQIKKIIEDAAESILNGTDDFSCNALLFASERITGKRDYPLKHAYVEMFGEPDPVWNDAVLVLDVAHIDRAVKEIGDQTSWDAVFMVRSNLRAMMLLMFAEAFEDFYVEGEMK